MPEQKSLSGAVRGVIDRIFATFGERQWDSVLRSYVLASREEQKCRLAAAMDLSVLLDSIKKRSRSGTALHSEVVIEEIIKGDWKNARRVASDISFDDMRLEDQQEHRRFLTELWAPFRARALAACDAADLLARVEDAEVEAAKRASSGTHGS